MRQTSSLRPVTGTPMAPRSRRSLLVSYDASVFAKEPGLRPVIFVKETTTVGETFKLLSDNNILSLPVRHSTGKREFFAFVDMLDILSFFFTVFGEHVTEDPEWVQAEGDMESYALKRGHFLDKPVGEICNHSRRNRWYAVQADSPLRALIDLFAIQGVHRVPIVSESGELLTLVTQSKMVKFLADHSDMIHEHFPKETIGELGLGIRPVITVPLSSTALSAFQTIQEQGVSGVGVVNDAGILVGNISASDLRLIRHASHFLEKLFLSCEEFIRAVALSRATAHIPDGPLTISPSFTLEEVFVKFAEVPVHRLYIVDAAGTLQGVLTLGDILNALLI
jgi:CBS domain-containing protein